ncbi:unnamed protein product, partial [Candidula unifasciata]
LQPSPSEAKEWVEYISPEGQLYNYNIYTHRLAPNNRQRVLVNLEVAVEVKKPEQKPAKARPVSSTPIAGTVWCVVRTSEGKCFFYNPTKRQSVWKMPEELKNRPDVEKLLSAKPDVTTEKKKEKDVHEGPPPKKMKSDDEVKEVKQANTKEVAQTIVFGKEAAIAAEIQAAQHRSVVSIEVRIKQFKELLAEKDVSAHSTWKKELHKIVFDKRYLLLTSRERKQVFEEYLKEKAEEERHEKSRKLKEKADLFRQLLEESDLNVKSSFHHFAVRHSMDNRFRSIDKMQDREAMFLEYIQELVKREKQENALIKEKVRNDFMNMLSEIPEISRRTPWRDVKYKVISDPRYEAAVTDFRRKNWFEEYVKSKTDLTSNETKKNEEHSKRSHSSSVREKEEREGRRESALEDFKKFLDEKVTDTEDSFTDFKSKFETNARGTADLSLAEKLKVYSSHIDGIYKKNREILWSILDGIDLSLTTVWDTVKAQVEADPRFVSYTDNEKKRDRDYAMFMHKKFLKAKKEFRELLMETKNITHEAKAMLEKGSITMKTIEAFLQKDQRYTTLDCVSEQREQMIRAYINELSEKTQPSLT